MKYSATFAAIAALAFTGAACANGEAKDDRGLSTLPTGTYVLDGTHGYVFMTYEHQGFSNPTIRFDEFDGTVEFNADDITASTVTVSIDPTTIDSGIAKFDTHLASGDMFDAEAFPEITFTSTSMDLETDYSGTLTGDLTIKGVTKPVTLDVTLNKAGTHAYSGKPTFGISATGEVMRSDFNMGYAVPAVSDKVSLRIEAEFSQK